MLRLPGKLTAGEVYTKNEAYQDGAYPVSNNLCWHSGIHIHSDSPVYPLTAGTLVACRISGGYSLVPRHTKLSREQYELLDEDERSFYRLSDYGICYVLRDGQENVVKKIAPGFALIKHTVPLPQSKDAPKQELNFFTLYMNLLPHQEFLKTIIPENSNDFSKDYCPITRGMDTDIPFYLKWVFKVTNKNLAAIQFAERDNFKIFQLSGFTTKDNFLGMSASDELNCIFENGADKKAHPLGRGFVDIDASTVQLTASRDKIPVYQEDREAGAVEIATLVNEAEFRFNGVDYHFPREAWNYEKDYIKILAAGSQIYSSSVEGWLYFSGRKLNYSAAGNTEAARAEIDRTIQQVRDGGAAEYECRYIDGSQIILKMPGDALYAPFVFTEPRVDAANSVYKIITLAAFCLCLQADPSSKEFIEYNRDGYYYDANALRFDFTEDGRFVKQVVFFSRGGSPSYQKLRHNTASVIIVRNNRLCFAKESLSQNVQYAFYYDTEIIKPNVVQNSFFGKSDSARSDSLKVFSVARMNRLNIRELYADGKIALEINKEHRPRQAFLEFVEGLQPCRIYFQGAVEYPLLVKARDIKVSAARGRVNFTFPGSSRHSRGRGLMLYDTQKTGAYAAITGGAGGSGVPASGPAGNARDFLQAGDIFEFTDPKDIFSNFSAPLLTQIIYKSEARYMLIKNLENLSAKLEVREEYKNFNAILNHKQNVTTGTLLGFPGITRRQPPVYDLVCLFNSAAFLDEKGPDIGFYKIPPAKMLYRLCPREAPAKRYYFPSGTVFKVEPEEKFSQKAYHVRIKSIQMFCRIKKTRAENDLLEKGKTYSVERIPEKFWLNKETIEYNEDTSIKIPPKTFVEDFAGAFRKFLRIIVGRRFPCLAKSGTNVPKFKIDLFEDEKFLIDFDFWVFAGELPGTADASGCLAFEGGEITAYKDKPLDYSFIQEYRTKPPLNDTVYLKRLGEAEDINGVKYRKFGIGTENFYISEADAEDCKTNFSDWYEHFTKIDADTNGDIFCNAAGISRKSLDEKRAIICSHPLEWDKNLYGAAYFRNTIYMNDDEGYDLLQKEAEILDIREGLKNCQEIEPEGNNFSFAHPIYFITHLDKMGVFNFNPYLGRRLIKPEARILNPFTKESKAIDFIVKDNPGFAPYDAGRGEFSGYLRPTSYFNEDFWNVHKDDRDRNGNLRWKSHYCHEGLDFGEGAGYGESRATEIRSLINGTVMLVGTHIAPNDPGGRDPQEHKNNPNRDSMGDFMIVQDTEDPFKYYLLVHLAWRSWEEFKIQSGSLVHPEQPVARIGHADPNEAAKSGNYHLHLSVVRAETFKKKNLAYGQSDFPGNDIINESLSFPVWDDSKREYTLNPFDCNDEYWGGRK
jgi:hypothetical protein